MKCTNNKDDKYNDNLSKRMRRKKRRRKSTFFRIVMLLLLLLIFGGGFGTYYVLAHLEDVRFSMPYTVTDPAYSVQIQKSTANYAASFAQDLCVPVNNVSLAGADVSDVYSGLLFDINTKEVMYAQNVHEKLYPASITKVMTALIALEKGNLDDMVTVSQEAVNQEDDSQVCNLKAGDTISLNQLLYGLLVWSGNDAGTAIAEHIGGTEEAFVEMMNEEAARIGATNTHYSNAHGLHEEDHYTTAYDIYLIFQEALKYDVFVEIINSPSYIANYTHQDGSAAENVWQSTNQYFTGESKTPKDVTVIGGKTGTTDAAGNCLVLLSKDLYGDSYISVVLKADSKDFLYKKTSELLSTIND